MHGEVVKGFGRGSKTLGIPTGSLSVFLSLALSPTIQPPYLPTSLRLPLPLLSLSLGMHLFLSGFLIFLAHSFSLSVFLSVCLSIYFPVCLLITVYLLTPDKEKKEHT